MMTKVLPLVLAMVAGTVCPFSWSRSQEKVTCWFVVPVLAVVLKVQDASPKGMSSNADKAFFSIADTPKFYVNIIHNFLGFESLV